MNTESITKCRPRLEKPLALTFIVATAFLTTACADYVSRRETVGFAAGDAVAANKVLQIIDPWDRRASWTDIDQDGNRAVRAVDTYRSGESSGSESDTVSASDAGLTQ